MATVKIVITDAPHGVTAVIEGNPPIPMRGADPKVEELTNAQAVAIGAMMALTDEVGGDWRVLLQ